MPIVRTFNLKAVQKTLLKQTEFVADAVSVKRKVVSRRAVKKTCRKPAQPSVAESAVLDGFHNVDVDSAQSKQTGYFRQKIQHEQIVENHSPGEIFGGKIVCPPPRFTIAAAPAPIIRNGIHHRIGKCAVQLLRIRLVYVYLIVAAQNILRAPDDPFCIHKHDSVTRGSRLPESVLSQSD